MQYRRMGRLDAEVSVLGFGGASVSGEGKGYGFGEIQEQAAIDLLRAALDLGINLFDTAPIYGFGLSEQRIGKAFAGQRDRVFLVSKCGVTWDRHQRVGIDNSPQKTEEMLHQSLRDLQTDYIDLYFVHWPDPNVDIRRTMEVLAKARNEQKIRAIGLSNTSPQEIARAMEIDRVDVLQGSFHLFEGYARDVLFPLVDEHGMGFMSYGTLDKGILTGRVTAEREKSGGFDPSDIRSHAPWWKEADRTLKYKAMDALRPLLEKHGQSGLEMALGYVLGFTQVSTALCGVRDRKQLESAVAALSHLPDAEFLQEAEEIALDCLGKKR